MWICLILFESKFHNNIMKQALWYYVIFIYQETTTLHIFSKCLLFFFLPLPLCLVLSGFFLAWVPGLRTHYIYPTRLPYHFSNWPTPIPDVKFQTLLCALSNQGFNHKNQFESQRTLNYSYHFSICFSGYFVCIVNLGNIKEKIKKKYVGSKDW